ncbi:hypothetical protein LCGC14_1734940, partial [marine sediment metagenome]
MKKNNSNSSKDIIPKLGEVPHGEGLLKNLPEPEETFKNEFRQFVKVKCKRPDVVFLHIEGEVFQCITIPVDLISIIPNHNDKRIRQLFTERLMIPGQNGELIEKGGIYVFFQTIKRPMTKKIYIGESINLITRLKNHPKKKEGSFSSILIITSLVSIGKEKLKVLESMLIEELKKNRDYDIINKQEQTNFHVDILEGDLIKKYL